MNIFISYEKVESAVFEMLFTKACFEKLGFSGWCFASPSMYGCKFSCGAYNEADEPKIQMVFDELVESLNLR